MNTKSLVMAVGAAGLILTGGSAVSNAGFYDGKTVTVIVNAGAGGGLTRASRVFTGHMQKHLGSGAKMIIKNIPGGAGVKGLNFLAEKAKPNGMTVVWGPPQQMAVLVGSPGVRYKPEEFHMIGVADTSFVTLMRSDTGKGVKNAKDMIKAGGLIVGGRGPSSALDIFARTPLHIMGIKYRYVPGYRAQPKMNAALLAKEINFLNTGHQGYVAFYSNTILKDGRGTALYYHSPLDKNGEPIRLKRYPANIKHFVDYYKDTHGGKKPSGPLWEAYKWFATYSARPMSILAPKGTPAPAVAALRTAYGKTTKDPAFQAAYRKMFKMLPNYLVGKDAEWLLTTYQNISPTALKGMKELVKKRKKKK